MSEFVCECVCAPTGALVSCKAGSFGEHVCDVHHVWQADGSYEYLGGKFKDDATPTFQAGDRIGQVQRPTCSVADVTVAPHPCAVAVNIRRSAALMQHWFNCPGGLGL